jgi:acyl-CoA thioesterase-1
MRAMPAYSPPHVLALGDSLTAGYGLPTRDSFAAKLQQALHEHYPGAIVHNAGVSGNTTADALRRLPRVLSGLVRKPDFAIVELGANDLRRGVAPARTRANLDQILAILTSCGITTLLTTFKVPPFLKAHAASYDGLYADVASRHGAVQASFFPPGVMGNPHLTLPDGLHPNARAIELVVAHLLPVIASALEHLCA